MSIANRLAKNAGASTLQKVVTIGQHILLVPLFLHYWGPETYGEWLTLSAIPAALALSDLGLASAFSNQFVIRHAGGQLQAAADVLKTGLYFLIASCLLALALGLLALGLAWQQGWLSHLSVGKDTAVQVLIILATSRIIAFFAGLYEGCFRAGRRTHAFMLYSALALSAQVVTAIVVLVSGHGLVVYAMTQSGIMAMLTVVLCWVGIRCIPPLPKGKLIRDRKQLYPLLRKGVSYMLIPFQQALSVQGTTLVIRSLLGAEAVAIFGTIRTLSNSGVQALTVVSHSLLPELQMSMAEKRHDTSQRLYASGLLVSTVIGLFAALSLGLFGMTVYGYWTHGKLQPSQTLWTLFMAMLVVRSLWMAASIVFTAANRPEAFTIIGFAAAFTGVFLSWLLAPAWGLSGVAMGCLVMEMIILSWALPGSCKIVGIPPFRILSYARSAGQDLQKLGIHHWKKILTRS